MTNGEKIQKDFKSCKVCEPIVEDDTIHVIFADKKDTAIGFDLSWWNAEYQEPSSSEIPKNSPTETLVSLAVYKEVARERDIAIQQLHELGYEFGQKIEPVIRDNGIKDELNQVKDELEPTTKKDLGVDCIDRQAAITFVCKNTEEILKDTMPLEVKLSDDYLYENVAKIMRDPKVLTSVTPIRPKGHWIETAEEYYKAINEKGGGVNEDTDYFVDDIACSECLAKFSVIDNEAERFDFCPCCGSDNR